MPVKTVTCCICQKEVSKRSTLAIGEGRACREHTEVKACIDESLNAIKHMKAEWPEMKSQLIMSFRLECSRRMWRNVAGAGGWEDDYPVKEFVGRMYKQLTLTTQQVDEVMSDIKSLKLKNEFMMSLPEIILEGVRMSLSNYNLMEPEG